MNNIKKYVSKFEKEINRDNFKGAEIYLLDLINEVSKYYVNNNFYNNNKCGYQYNNNDYDFNYIQKKLLILNQKFLNLKEKYYKNINTTENCNSINSKILTQISSINKNLSDFMYDPLNVTPQFLMNNNFYASLSKYETDYILLLKQTQLITQLTNNNLLSKPIEKKNKILIITFDDRHNVDYIKIHNTNFSKYASKYNIDYKYEHLYNYNLNTNPYWYKIYLVKYYLDTNIYDYVMWVDSDTLIKDFTIDLNEIINSYSSDLYFCDDNLSLQKINAGMFIIKNSKIGRQYISDCINNFCDKCINKGETKLKGNWATVCYEQGIMNIVLIKNYFKNSTVLPLHTVLCSQNGEYFKYFKKIFILHYYDSSTEERNKLFKYLQDESSW
jgi:hypothetical protein